MRVVLLRQHRFRHGPQPRTLNPWNLVSIVLKPLILAPHTLNLKPLHLNFRVHKQVCYAWQNFKRNLKENIRYIGQEGLAGLWN